MDCPIGRIDPSPDETRPADERLRDWANRRGYGIAWGDARIITEVQQRIQQRRDAGELDERFFSTVLAGTVKPLAGQPTGTAIAVAVPRPAHQLAFETAVGKFVAIMPPTYVAYGTIMDDVQRELSALLAPASVASLRTTPLKSLAVRLGLARYGRNNVTYTDTTGSHHQLAAFVTDLQLDAWPGLQDLETMLGQCSACDACRRACPTGAIAPDRYLLHGERCVAFFNEYSGDWPSWLGHDAHSALIGCMRCVGVCPANQGKLKVETIGEPFTAAETEVILNGCGNDGGALWQSIASKLAGVDCAWLADNLSRNLKAVMAAAQR